MSKSSLTNYPGFFQRYIEQVPEESLPDAFNKQTPFISSFLSSVPKDKYLYAYAEGKWTIKEVLQHIIDTERIMAYRALSFARKEKAALPGFEEKDYAANSNANNRTWQSLGNEFLIVRQSTHLLFNSLTEEMLASEGTANNNLLSVETIGFIILGHFYHHKKIVEEIYLDK
jgi:hypothetical protein